MHIFFDFDRTLINTDALKLEQYRRIAALNDIPEELIVAAMEDYISSLNSNLDFDISSYAKYLAENLSVDPSTVIKVHLNDISYIRNFVYDEVFFILNSLQKKGFKLGIFSQAVKTHQLLKIEASGVLDYISVDNVFIFPRKLNPEAIKVIPRDSAFLDDDESVIRKSLSLRKDIRAIWLNRGEKADSGDLEYVSDLTQFCDLMVQSIN